MSSLWGIPDNWAPSIDGSDQRKAALDMAQLGQIRANTERLGVMTQEEKIKVAREGVQLQMQQKYLQRLSQQAEQGVQQTVSQEQQLTQMANDEMAMGHPDKAAHIISSLAQTQNHQEQARLARDKLKDAEQTMAAKRQQDILELFAAGDTPEDFQRAQMMVQGRYPDVKLPPEFQTYNPKFVGFLKKVTKHGAQEQKEEDFKERQQGIDSRLDKRLDAQGERLRETLAAQESRAREAQSRADARLDQREKWAQQERQQHEAWQERQKKETGTKEHVVGDPKDSMVKAADAMVRREFPNLPGEIALGKDQVSSAAYDIASQAKARMNANRGLSSSEAMAQVYTDMKKRGSFSTETQKGFFSDKKVDKYVPKEEGKPDAKPPAKKAAADYPAKNAKGWSLLQDKNGNLAYVSPDKKQVEEVK